MAQRSSEEFSDKTMDLAKQLENSSGPIESPERYTQDGIAERREHVLRFMVRRVPQTVMAKLLGVSRRTICEDVKFLNEQAGDRIKRLKTDAAVVESDIGMTSIRLEGIAQAAFNDYELEKSPQFKNAFLNTAIKAEATRARLLIETGVYPKAGEDIKVTHTVKSSFADKLGSDSPLSTLDDPASARRVLSAAEKILKLSLKEGNVIDVNGSSKPVED